MSVPHVLKTNCPGVRCLSLLLFPVFYLWLQQSDHVGNSTEGKEDKGHINHNLHWSLRFLASTINDEQNSQNFQDREQREVHENRRLLCGRTFCVKSRLSLSWTHSELAPLSRLRKVSGDIYCILEVTGCPGWMRKELLHCHMRHYRHDYVTSSILIS